MKAIIWISIAGALFWWMMIDRSSRESTYRGAQYFVSRLGAAVGIRPKTRTSETLATTPAPPPVAQPVQPRKPRRGAKRAGPTLVSPEQEQEELESRETPRD